jgi:hypothetical protein
MTEASVVLVESADGRYQLIVNGLRELQKEILRARRLLLAEFTNSQLRLVKGAFIAVEPSPFGHPNVLPVELPMV